MTSQWTPDGGPPATTCAWCGAPLGDGARRLRGRIRCPRCSVATTSPWPAAEQLDAAYAGPYRPSAGRFAGFGDRLFQATRARLAARIDAVAPPGPVLDVGAGDGTLVRALRARGREAIGLEREARGEHLVDATVHEVDGPFAAAVLWHSLEHLPDAGAAFDAAAARLAPGGVLFVAIPDAASVQARAFGDRWLALDLPRHLVHLTRRALLDRCAQAGLRVERVSGWRGGQVAFGWAHGLVGALPGAPSLYDAIRRPAARWQRMPARRRVATLAAGVVLAPLALAAAAAEIALGRSGTVYVEARRSR